ncbi:BPTD_3080 family restriction endonuclease [Mesorhizobium sp. M0408]|uniref:BPTD_3080 family restriction endonuclease n=1 Tax=Mesorhizobium sp. M0408 TaxID=2956942 RepID=UPI00333B9480
MKPFYEKPILNSPYHSPTRHHALGDSGQPLDHEPLNGRRRSRYMTPVPRSKKQTAKASQGEFGFEDEAAGPRYSDNPIINEIRTYVAAWRTLPNPTDWGVTPTTQRLLQHWRNHNFADQRPFFCQIEAVETAIWLAEVARGRRQYAGIFNHLDKANAEANPDLFRIALKLATGAGKTTVMAMLIAWQAINYARQPGSSLFSKGFLLVAPGITIKDRLRVLLPSDPENYYRTRELVPPDMMNDLGNAKIVITNYHAFQQRETLDTNKVGRAVLSGWRNEKLVTRESEGEMLERACKELLSTRNVVVINDEAHHCYREKSAPLAEDLKGDDKAEAAENNAAARLWISGLEALKRKVGLRAVYDLSATPFFLRGSGYDEGTLFPWVVSDFSLVDAIECGIVKLPRVPVSDNAVNAATPVFRNLWDHIGKKMPKKGAAKSGELDPRSQFPDTLATALHALYSHYEKEYDEWQRAAIGVPPVFIVVCNNTASSRLVYEWISGFQRDAEGERQTIHWGNLRLFSNFDEHTGNPLPRMNTILVDSYQIESGTLDDAFKQIAAPEIERFRQEKAEREGAASAGAVSDSEILREVMNTVGRKGRVGEHVRCVVSVSMLTEGWDANTVTHILGVRAFGTQLLCEQVVGRGLRRQSYALGDETDLDGNRLFEPEYADILGIPFDFATEPVDVKKKPPKPVTRVFAVKERSALSMRLPRVAGYRTELPDDQLTATFTDEHRLVLDPSMVGPTTARLEGLVGLGHDIAPDILDEMRPAAIATHLSKHLLERYLLGDNGEPQYHLYYKLQPLVRRWIKECFVPVGGTRAGMLTYASVANRAASLIHGAILQEAGNVSSQIVKALLDPYNPAVVTDHVQFITSKAKLYETNPQKCQINYVVADSGWETEFARVVEAHPQTLAYVKNQALGFEVPYLAGTESRKYVPDFIVRLDDGHGADDPLMLVVEVKGERLLDDQVKAETMRSLFVPGVNNLGTFGRWGFVELTDEFRMEADYAAAVETLSVVRHLERAN